MIRNALHLADYSQKLFNQLLLFAATIQAQVTTDTVVNDASAGCGARKTVRR